MTDSTLREQLHQQLDALPEDLIREIADFTLFLMMRRGQKPEYVDWTEDEGNQFVLRQFFREESEAKYRLADDKKSYPEQTPRADWDDAFERMAARGDDGLIDLETPNTKWDEDEWEW